MSSNQFVDYFGAQAGAKNYAAARPTYPPSFLNTIISKCPQKPKSLIDIGCGTGQATFYLSSQVDLVVGMDPSEGQVKEATVQAEKLGLSKEKLRFVKGGAEDLTASGLALGSVDMITAAQCAHWFDLPAFYEQAKATLSPSGVLALWCYTAPTMPDSPVVQAAFSKFYGETIGPYWPPSRLIVEGKYEAIQPPFPRVERLEDAMEYELDAKGILDYVSTWSALQVARKKDPSRDWLKELRETLESLDPNESYRIVTPIYAVVAYQQ